MANIVVRIFWFSFIKILEVRTDLVLERPLASIKSSFIFITSTTFIKLNILFRV